MSVEANCNIANEETNELGLDLSLRNVNQIHHLLMAETLIGNVHLFCSKYTLDSSRIHCKYLFFESTSIIQLKPFLDIKNPTFEKVCVQKQNLSTNDSLNMRCLLAEKDDSINRDMITDHKQYINKKLSSFKVAEIDHFEDEILQMKHMGNFLLKNETMFLPFSQQNISNEEFNNLLNQNNKHMTLCITWKALIYDEGTIIRNAYGQHFVQLKNLFES